MKIPDKSDNNETRQDTRQRMPISYKTLPIIAALVALALLAGCSGLDGEPGRFTVGGSVTGLDGDATVVLQNNGIDELAIENDGEFTFVTTLTHRDPFEVTVKNQPAGRDCVIGNGAGRMPSGNVTNVAIDCFPELVLQATPGGGRILLSWNADDFPGTKFDLCQAEAPIDGGVANCAAHDGGTLAPDAESPFQTDALDSGTAYWFLLEAAHPGGQRTLSVMQVRSIPTGIDAPFAELNDTGVDWCADEDTNINRTGTANAKLTGCAQAVPTHPGQDAFQGRDAAANAGTLVKTGDGPSGFDFTRICNSGQPAGVGACPATPFLGLNPNDWGCSRDNVTGLIWEIKVGNVNHLRSLSHSYSWFDPGQAAGANQGVQDGGLCAAIDGSCNLPAFNSDTYAFIEAVNAAGMCGASDWRLATIDELHSIAHRGALNPALPLGALPNFDTTNPVYWSGTTVAGFSGKAWTMNFNSADDGWNDKFTAYRARLVRGGPAIPPADAADIADNASACDTGLAETAPSGDFTAIGDGSIVRHVPTGLEWQRCARGQEWNGSECTGAADIFTWREALIDAGDQDGWRLPNAKELGSLVERCADAPAINQQVFPNAPGAAFFSATPAAVDPETAWVVHYLSGNDNPVGKHLVAHVRLVRDGGPPPP